MANWRARAGSRTGQSSRPRTNTCPAGGADCGGSGGATREQKLFFCIRGKRTNTPV